MKNHQEKRNAKVNQIVMRQDLGSNELRWRIRSHLHWSRVHKEKKAKEGTAMAFAAHDDIDIVEVVLTHTGKEL
jgi:hypothetical protein